MCRFGHGVVVKTKRMAKKKLEFTVNPFANSGTFFGKMVDFGAKLTQSSDSDDAAPFSASSL